MLAPLFLARRAYRQRRLADAARLLPLLGGFLFLLPILWNTQATPAADTGSGGIYLFAVWAGLILAAAVLARMLGRQDEEADAPGGAAEGGRGRG